MPFYYAVIVVMITQGTEMETELQIERQSHHF